MNLSDRDLMQIFKERRFYLPLNQLLIWLMVGLASISTFSHGEEQNQRQTLYFDMGIEGGWVPYHTGAETGRAGVFIELANALQQKTGVKLVAVHFPPKRAEKALLDGIVDFDFVCLEWLKDHQPGEQFVATEPFFEIVEYLVTLKENTHLYPTRESMFGKPVGTIAGYFYFDDKDIVRTDFLNENRLMQGLKHHRYEVAILERETAKYWAKLNDTAIGFAAVHTRGKLVIRINKKYQNLLPTFNQAISEMKASGELQALLDRHGIDAAIQ